MRKIFKIGVIAIGAAMLAGVAAAATDCTPSKWGKNDTLGSANWHSPNFVDTLHNAI